MKNEKELDVYVPQPDFLRLLNTGDGKSIGAKYGISFYGNWVWKLKDWIDVTWMTAYALENVATKGNVHFKPKVGEEESKEAEKKEEELTVKIAGESLLLNDEVSEKKESFATQWKTLVKMNENKEFAEKVVAFVKEAKAKGE